MLLAKPVQPEIEDGCWKNLMAVELSSSRFVEAMENVSSFLDFCCSVSVFEQIYVVCKQILCLEISRSEGVL